MLILPFPSQRFQVNYHSLSKVFSSFLHSTFSLSVSHRYLALEDVYPPLQSALPSTPTLRISLSDSPQQYRTITFLGGAFQPTCVAESRVSESSLDYNSRPEGPRFTSWALTTSLAGTKVIIVIFFFLRLVICLSSAGTPA